ncbi:hypothetical protein D5086_002680 [Populus alba]|uniref:Uncharacterized protein n=2 Tax=Populus alba TaxID=43335 RepID=A0ACC4D2D5_POPAL|nr:O-acyltransferase WSD1-like [Populus alba]TKS08103.1 O-acyltransferase WSD1-like [Populus alba]
MAPPESDSVEPVTPAGRLFLLPEMNTIIHCAIGVKNKLDIDSTRSAIKNSLMLKHPRFCSLLVRDKNGREHWKKTDIDVDQHFIIVNKKTCTDDVDKVVNEYIADLSVSTPLDMNKPLWEVHVMLEQKCVIMRIHHALGDGISLMSMFLASCRTASDPEAIPTLVTGRRPDYGKEGKQKDWRGVILRVLKMVWFGIAFSLEFVLRFLWVSDKKTVISGGDGVELWPRKLATAKFMIEDMKTVKEAVPNATINDVLFGVISSGLSRYLDHRSPKALKEGQQITGMAMVNLREQLSMQDLSEMLKNNSGSQSRWGNRFGFILLPVFYRKSDVNPLQHVGRAKTMIDRKKKSSEGHFTYHIGHLAMALLGPKAAHILNYRVLCNTTFTFSNVVGPQEVVTMSGNPVTFIRVNTSSIPHALTMHMVSYAGRADMQIMVAKDIIPDPEFLAKCFEDALVEMKEAAAATV